MSATVAAFQNLSEHDAIVTFNYDPVIERALRRHLEARQKPFGKWLYALGRDPSDPAGPILLKLHGSSNWTLTNRPMPHFSVRTHQWDDFSAAPGYGRGDLGEGTVFPIFLPFWDKKVEDRPWLDLWTTAFQKLTQATEIVVWGYSLPSTDVKAEHLFTLARSKTPRFRLCVIDPAQGTRQRWRDLFRDALFWQYSDIVEFKRHPPSWWNR